MRCDSQSNGASYNDEISLMILKYNFGSYTDDWIRYGKRSPVSQDYCAVYP